MAEAAKDPILRECFERHVLQTQGHAERLQAALELLGEGAESDSETCRGMQGLIEEGEEIIEDGREKDQLISDLALISAAQKVEHYEIAGYGTARCLAKQLGQQKLAKLLSYTLGEEESADFLLTEITKPILQKISSQEIGNGTQAPWGEPGESVNASNKPVMGNTKARSAAAGGNSPSSKSRRKG
jgi:Mn-containing catalase